MRWLQDIREFASRLHRDEQGAEGLEKLLIIGAVILPLLGILIYFRGQISEWVDGLWTEVQDDTTSYTDFNPGG